MGSHKDSADKVPLVVANDRTKGSVPRHRVLSLWLETSERTLRGKKGLFGRLVKQWIREILTSKSRELSKAQTEKTTANLIEGGDQSQVMGEVDSDPQRTLPAATSIRQRCCVELGPVYDTFVFLNRCPDD